MSTDDWATSQIVADPLFEYFRGPVGLDPCSNERSVVRAKRTYTAAGLHLPWDASTNYENPPYSNLLNWTAKGMEELCSPYRGRPKVLVRLVPATPSTEWWLNSLMHQPLLVFTKRLPFIDEKGEEDNGARFDCVLQHYIGAGDPRKLPKHLRRERFLDVFDHLTRWVIQVDRTMAWEARKRLAKMLEEKATKRARKKGAKKA